MSLTPMMQQYQEAKQRHPDALLLFRMGDFYELFHEDAEVAARTLKLTLTSRDKQVPMAGFPHTQLDSYLRKLLQAGFRVAICEQVEDAAEAKGLVKREVVRVVTAGTVTEEGLLDPRRPNILAAAVRAGPTAGIAWVDPSTGQFRAADFACERLVDELVRLSPAECLWSESSAADVLAPLNRLLPQMVLTRRPDWNFDPATALAVLRGHFQVGTLAGFGFDDRQPCLRSAGTLLLYLQETLKSALYHLSRLQPFYPEDTLFLDLATRRSLELDRTIRSEERQGSLLAAIDRTTTAMGSRLLREWLFAPLCRREPLNARLDAVAEFKANHSFRSDTRALLRQVLDLPRLTARASTGRASPRDLTAIAATLKVLPPLKALLAERRAALLVDLENRLDLCGDLRAAIESTLVDSPPLSPREGGLIRSGAHAELDRLRELSRGGKEWIARFQAREIERTGIASLKVGFNQVFGYYLEVTHAHAAKVPADYQRKQTLKNAERYITPELKEYEERVLSAEEQSRQLEYDLFVELRQRIALQAPRLLQTAEVLAELDVLAGLADVADSFGYCRPELCDEPVLAIEAGRHPVLEQVLPAGTFVPNDLIMSPDAGVIHLITGPNMAGKSTFIRQAALITLMAQIGSFVPARQARIGFADRIFTRVGYSDELARGQSTFMVEMVETANILHNATARSLVVLDEIGRGTSTYDGLALAWAVAEHLHNRIGCRTLFATHYHELTQLAETLSGLRNYNAQVQEDRGEVVFVHRVGAGPAGRSYGIHVAQLAGVPGDVVRRAAQVLRHLESQHAAGAEALRQSRKRRPTDEGQPDLFAKFS